MNAAYINETGGVEKINYGKLPIPDFGSTDVMVKMEASNVNHVDLFVRSGAYKTQTPFPFVIGRDLVGTVVEIGSGVTTFKLGDKVWCNSLGHHGRQGAFSEYAVVSQDRLYHLPNGVELKEAVSVLHTAATAHIGLFREARLKFGETVFVEGAGGGVGSAVVQLALAAGANVIATSSNKDEAWVKGLGVQKVFDYNLKDVYSMIMETAEDGIDIWWDTSGQNNFNQCVPMLSMGGRAVVMAGLKGKDSSLSVGEMYTKDISLRGFAISNASISDLSDAAANINHLLSLGKLKSRIGAVYNLADSAKAHEAMSLGEFKGRIVVVP